LCSVRLFHSGVHSFHWDIRVCHIHPDPGNDVPVQLEILSFGFHGIREKAHFQGVCLKPVPAWSSAGTVCFFKNLNLNALGKGTASSVCQSPCIQAIHSITPWFPVGSLRPP
jgi:hypothetical protein